MIIRFADVGESIDMDNGEPEVNIREHSLGFVPTEGDGWCFHSRKNLTTA